MNLRRNTDQGFTFIELLLVIVIICILAAVVLPNLVQSFDKAKDRAKVAAVKVNMRAVQIAVESYAADHGGEYPIAPPSGNDEFSSYFPGGSSDGKTMGVLPNNPFTNQVTVFETLTIEDVKEERAKAPAKAAIVGKNPGQIGYSAIGTTKSGHAASYVLEGVDATSAAIADPQTEQTLVLSNQ